MNGMDYKKMERGITEFITGLFGDEILNNPNFKETPMRVVKSYAEMLQGEFDIERQVEFVMEKKFPSEYMEIIMTDWIVVHSICPHHLLPVSYKVAIAYLPAETIKKNSYLIGASKLARLADVLSKRAVIQEQFTHDIAVCLEKHLNPSGVAVIVKGIHACMRCRGIRTGASFKTSKMTGAFKTNDRVRAEFYELLKI